LGVYVSRARVADHGVKRERVARRGPDVPGERAGGAGEDDERAMDPAGRGAGAEEAVGSGIADSVTVRS
jgi:hypothetical protein